jgi:hypothetical protein
VTINTLPDDILRELFRELFVFCPSESCPDRRYWRLEAIEHTTAWQSLVQVCQRWRNIIYGSPRYLDLHIHCSDRKPFRKNSNRWPEFPLTLQYTICPDEEDDDVVFALARPDHVHRIDLSIRHSGCIVDVLGVMEVPFPALTHFVLVRPDPEDDHALSLPYTFLGGSAPCLQHLHLDRIFFPGLPKLLLSARGLVCLQLDNIPAYCCDYISSEEMVGGLAGLTRLRKLFINFMDPSYYNRPNLPGPPDPPRRTPLPALAQFQFTGENEYLEALIAQIEMPQVEVVDIWYCTPELKTRQLSQFIGRTARLESAQFRHAQVVYLNDGYAKIELDRPLGECNQVRLSFSVVIESDYYNVPRLLGQLAVILSNVDHLSVEMGQYLSEKVDKTETSEWLAFLHLFPAVEVLHVSGGIAVNMASTLENIPEEGATKVLPALRLLHLRNGDEPVGSTARFLSLRELAGCPVTVVDTQDKINE